MDSEAKDRQERQSRSCALTLTDSAPVQLSPPVVTGGPQTRSVLIWLDDECGNAIASLRLGLEEAARIAEQLLTYVRLETGQ